MMSVSDDANFDGKRKLARERLRDPLKNRQECLYHFVRSSSGWHFSTAVAACTHHGDFLQ